MPIINMTRKTSLFIICLFFPAILNGSKCWWSSCKLPTSSGCENVNSRMMGFRACGNKVKYFCCEQNGSTRQGTTEIYPTVSSPYPSATTQNIVGVSPGCWWTGCEPDNGASMDCGLYGQQEIDKKKCGDGYTYHCCPRTPTLASSGECWWTGCHIDSWSVTGCEQYGRIEGGKTKCDGGYQYNCCVSNSKLVAAPTATTSSPTPLTSTYIPTPLTTASTQGVRVNSGCWWTGCQPDVWAAKGCGQYGQAEAERKECADGHSYHCCPGTPGSTPPSVDDCWWTGCQLDTWAVTGCSQYGRIERGKTRCEGGDQYNCCLIKSSKVVATATAIPIQAEATTVARKSGSSQFADIDDNSPEGTEDVDEVVTEFLKQII